MITNMLFLYGLFKVKYEKDTEDIQKNGRTTQFWFPN